jgi:hypothetical protein
MLPFNYLVAGATPDHLGFIPHFMDASDPRPAVEQLNEGYNRLSGCSWSPQSAFTIDQNGGLKYPGDPVMKPIAEARLRDEVIRMYEYGYVSVQQPDGSFEAARMD